MIEVARRRTFHHEEVHLQGADAQTLSNRELAELAGYSSSHFGYDVTRPELDPEVAVVRLWLE
jgi:hypothetical protein